MQSDGAVGVRVKDELDVVLGLLGLDKSNRLLADVHQAVEGFGRFRGLRWGVGELQKREEGEVERLGDILNSGSLVSVCCPGSSNRRSRRTSRIRAVVCRNVRHP